MSVEKRFFGKTSSGQEVTEYTIKNGSITAKVLDFGVVLTQLIVPDKKGNEKDVVLGYDSLEAYEVNNYFFGATIGPSANRIGKAACVIEGRTCHLAVNENANNLHTDFNDGLHKRVWQADCHENGVTFTMSLKDGEYGLPGNRRVSVTVSVNEQSGLVFSYHMTSDKKTIMNLTNHSYFNLAGQGSGNTASQELQVMSRFYTPVDKESIPTGEIAPVEGTAFDFREAKPIGRDIENDEEQLHFTGGYDHNLIADGYEKGREKRLIAVASDPASGRTMQVYTDLPGVQFYAGNFIGEHEGKGGAHYGKRTAFCLETQFWPDAVNHENFPQPVFGGDTEMASETEYRFV